MRIPGPEVVVLVRRAVSISAPCMVKFQGLEGDNKGEGTGSLPGRCKKHTSWL